MKVANKCSIYPLDGYITCKAVNRITRCFWCKDFQATALYDLKFVYFLRLMSIPSIYG